MDIDLTAFQLMLDRPIRQKTDELQREGRLKHLIFAAQLPPSLLEKLRRTADMIRLLSRSKGGIDALRHLLSHKRAMLYFTQPSTRTFLSFMAACQILGLTCNEVRDRRTSSEVKGESATDTIRMFSSYFDLIIMRSPVARFAECCAYLMNDLENQSMRAVPIINGGSGADEHPTQALLDVYTILRTFQPDVSSDAKQSRFLQLSKEIDSLTVGPGNKTYVFCGDMGRGRTVRSLATVLAQYENNRFIFVSPDHSTLCLEPTLRDKLIDRGATVFEVNSLDASVDGKGVLQQADCLYMTRIQREHNTDQDNEEFESIDLDSFLLTPRRVERLPEYAPILHPFPRDEAVGEIPVSIDSDPRAMYFRQARNGMWVRAALLVHIFGVDDELYMMFNDHFGSD